MESAQEKFNIITSSFQQLQYFRVGTDERNESPDWLIDEVVVYVPDRNERYVFRNNKWIDNRDNPIDIPLGKMMMVMMMILMMMLLLLMMMMCC